MNQLIDKKFWQGRKVLITGHTGFKGTWLCYYLDILGAELTGYALEPPTSPSIFDLTKCELCIRSFIGDIRDYEKLMSVVNAAQPEIIFHMAAQPLVYESYLNPLETFSTNIIGTANVLEVARHCQSVKAVVNVTTDKVYENLETDRGYSENDRLGGSDPYSSSKACSEHITVSYQRSFFNRQGNGALRMVAVATARAGNVIGGGDWADNRLIPDCVRAALAGQSIIIRNGAAVRPWQHVLEPLAGYIILAQKLYLKPERHIGAWNFGPLESSCITVQEVVRTFAEFWDGDLTIETIPNPIHETMYLKLLSTKAKHSLGWVNVWGMEKTMRMIVEWYQAYRDQVDVAAVTIRQINSYLADQARILSCEECDD